MPRRKIVEPVKNEPIEIPLEVATEAEIVLDYTEKMRKDRGLAQKLFLIETVPVENPYTRKYVVMGSTGNVYKVEIKKVPSCTCPDHATRHKRCKHIYFVLMRIMNVIKPFDDKPEYTNDDLDIMFSNIPSITQILCVDDNIKKKYQNEKTTVETGVAQKSTDDLCPICLDDLENGDVLEHCKYSCGKPIHKVCFEMWSKQSGANCVYCRKAWLKEGGDKYINLIV